MTTESHVNELPTCDKSVVTAKHIDTSPLHDGTAHVMHRNDEPLNLTTSSTNQEEGTAHDMHSNDEPLNLTASPTLQAEEAISCEKCSSIFNNNEDLKHHFQDFS